MKHLLLALATAALATALYLGVFGRKEESIQLLSPPGVPVPASAELPRHWLIPDFSLTERSGRTVSAADLRGKVWVADFFYTSCPGPCPMMSSRLADVQKVTADLPDVALVSISADPERDTPAVLQEYAAKFHAGPGWLFLTGEKAAIHDLANHGFKLGVSEEGATAKEPVTHGTKLILIDKNGYVRAFYDALTPDDTARLLTDLQRLRKETR